MWSFEIAFISHSEYVRGGGLQISSHIVTISIYAKMAAEEMAL